MWGSIAPPSNAVDNMHGVLPTWDTPLSPGVQSLHWDSVVETWVTTHMTDLSPQPFRRSTDTQKSYSRCSCAHLLGPLSRRATDWGASTTE